MNRPTFPFSAILGQEDLKAALLLNAVDPGIGGVLIRGDKGTGKSTIVRALAGLLPDLEVVEGCPCNDPPGPGENLHDGCRERLRRGETLSTVRRPMPLVELPLSATEDRIVGTLHLESVLRSGERRFEPGLLAAANRGILYVDEVNLLGDHLVDLLLDAAASGENRVEREGLRASHPARFMLIGTMNPEEGELRPQFLDRFGLCITIQGIRDPARRKELAKRRLEFDRDPAAFGKIWQGENDLIGRQVARARELLEGTEIPEETLDQAVRIALGAQVAGHRADLAMLKTARALAALLEKPAAGKEELAEAARLVLPHRMSRGPLDTPESLDRRLQELLGEVLEGAAPPAGTEPAPPGDDSAYWEEQMEIPSATAAGSMLFTYLKKKLRNGSSKRMNGSASTASPPGT